MKIGRTHLQDATPIRLGQELGGYAAPGPAVGRCAARRRSARLRELPLGGTAVGTGINSHPDFAEAGDRRHRAEDRHRIRRSDRIISRRRRPRTAIVEASGLLKTIAVSLTKIANDIRWLASGPRCGIGEISIPATQPGSSIMPGKVNPVMSEMVLQVAAQVIGNDATVAWAGGDGQHVRAERHDAGDGVQPAAVDRAAVAGPRASSPTAASPAWRPTRERCEGLVEQSLAMCTSLAPLIGYDKAAEIAKESFKTGKTVRQVATEKKLLSEAELNKAMDARADDRSRRRI